MLRDNNRNESYFLGVLEQEKKAIERFEKIVFSLPDSNTVGLTRGKSILFHSYWKCCIASYSLGEPIDTVHNWLEKSVNILCYRNIEKDTITNSSFFELVSLTYLIGTLEEQNKLRECVLKFQLIDPYLSLLLNLEQKTRSSYICLLNEINKNNNEDYVCLIKEFLVKGWYSQQKDKWWYDSLKKNDNTYIGYWAFDVLAIIKHFHIQTEAFENLQFYPKDILI